MTRPATPGFHWARTCPNSPVGIPPSPAAVMPGPADEASHTAAPHRVAPEAPVPGARPGPGMTHHRRRVDAGPSRVGRTEEPGEAGEGSTWPHRHTPHGIPPARRSLHTTPSPVRPST